MTDIDTYSYLYESLDGYKHYWKIVTKTGKLYHKSALRI